MVTNNGNRFEEEGVSDHVLLEGLRTSAGMNAAIGEVYRLYFSSLSWYVMNNSGTKQDAQDIFQEVVITFIRLVQEGKFRGESSVKTFLFSLNRHAWLNELKKRNRALAREEQYEREQDRQVCDISYFIADRESREKLDQLIAQLGENCRKILTLYYFENLAVKEILERLDYENEQVIRNKKYKCMKQLKALIEANPAALEILKSMMHG